MLRFDAALLARARANLGAFERRPIPLDGRGPAAVAAEVSRRLIHRLT